MPEIAQALLKEKSRMGAEVRNVSVQIARRVFATGHAPRLPTASHVVGVARPCSTLLAVLVPCCWPRIMPCPVGLHVSERFAAELGVLPQMSQLFPFDAEGLIAVLRLEVF